MACLAVAPRTGAGAVVGWSRPHSRFPQSSRCSLPLPAAHHKPPACNRHITREEEEARLGWSPLSQPAPLIAKQCFLSPRNSFFSSLPAISSYFLHPAPTSPFPSRKSGDKPRSGSSRILTTSKSFEKPRCKNLPKARS